MSQGEVARTPVSFASADGMSTIRGYAWRAGGPDAARESRPRGVVVLVHGMAEHIERYDEFARYLAGAGYLVCGHNQIGHGSSAEPGRWGCLPAQGGSDALVEDVERLRTLAAAYCAPGTPCFVFGHSMGSFVARHYAATYGDRISGAVICGTGFVEPRTSRAGHAMALAIARMRGQDHRSALLHAMADGAYAKAIPNRRTDFDWLSHNQENVDAYIADDACGFMFSAGGYATLTELTAEVCTLECAQRVPHDLPLLYVAGAEDPVGELGRGVVRSAELARRAGSTDVTYRIFDGMRHEVLQEDGHAAVFECVRGWLDRHAPAPNPDPKTEA